MNVAHQLFLRFRGSDAPAEAKGPPRRKQRAPKARGASQLEGGIDAMPKVVGGVDPIMMAVVVALVAFGVVMVYSASAVYANRQYGDGHYFLIRQGIFATLGLLTMMAVARFDYHRYRLFTYPALFSAFGMLIFVALGFGHSAGGASRWIRLGPVNIQPAELAKLAVILWLAYSLSKKREAIRSFSVGFLPHALMALVLMLLCLKQPDFGSAVMIGVLTFVMMFAAGAKAGYLVGGAVLALPIGYALIATSDYRMRRIIAYQNPFEHRHGVGYQVAESLMSFGAGGLSGVGIGDSRQKLFFLPEAHTDFISAIVGEELGFVGIACLLLAYAILVLRGFSASWKASDDYGSYLAVGITAFLGLQAFTNLAVAMGMLPTKGLALPFMSYGGSSLLVNCAAVGILLNISRERDVPVREDESEQREARAKGERKRSRRGNAQKARALAKGGRA